MTLTVLLKPTDLAALLCGRICHDLISPIGAIQNAMELYDEGGGDEDVLQLIRLSVDNASARLQFARLAFGSAEVFGCHIDTQAAEQVAQKYMAVEKAVLKWKIPSLLLPKDEVKLLLNLLLVANATIPRGGEITVEILQDADRRSFRFKILGEAPRIPPHFIKLYSGDFSENLIDSQVSQLYYTVLLSEITEMTIHIQEAGGHIILDSTKHLRT